MRTTEEVRQIVEEVGKVAEDKLKFIEATVGATTKARSKYIKEYKL